MDRARRGRRPWTLERVLFAMAGTMTLAGVLLARAVSPWFLVLTAFVGANQLLFVVAGDCPASLALRRLGLAPRSAAGADAREARPTCR